MKIYIIKCLDDVRNIGNGEIVFIFENKKDAFEAIKENSCDFQDHAYKYCILEGVEFGTYLPEFNYPFQDITYYKFKDNKWVKIKNPKGEENE
ncbi:MAG: hypothetical protein PHX62_09450 [Bacilli bacterium]|jgi:hypothetical protein|nr:hypothetical protein [Bacilli bacterium]